MGNMMMMKQCNCTLGVRVLCRRSENMVAFDWSVRPGFVLGYHTASGAS
jgi:hypothetical protein